MKIQVKPGTRLQLDGRRSVSAKGGVYDIGKLSEADQKRILATDGVSEVKSPSKAKDGDK